MCRIQENLLAEYGRNCHHHVSKVTQNGQIKLVLHSVSFASFVVTIDYSTHLERESDRTCPPEHFWMQRVIGHLTNSRLHSTAQTLVAAHDQIKAHTAS